LFWLPVLLKSNPRNHCTDQWHRDFHSCFLLVTFQFQVLCLSLLTIWADIFIWCERRSQFHSLHVDIQCSQHSSLKRLFFLNCVPDIFVKKTIDYKYFGLKNK
jgi:hypothetical protein